MAARNLPEWIGKTPDTKIPPRVRLRIFDRNNQTCHLCKLPIKPGETFEADHVVALVNGGENRETNLAPAHSHCHVAKTGKDVAEKAKITAIRKKHLRIVDGPKMQGRPFARSSKSARREAKPRLPPRQLFDRPRAKEAE